MPDFRVLQNRMHVRKATTVARLVQTVPVTYMVFDLLRLDGRDLTREPLEDRRALLTETFGSGSWQVPTSYDDGQMLFDATLEQGLEGIVSKRRSSRYAIGERSKDWLKFAHRHRLSYVVGGWRPQEGTSDRLAALLVGEPTPGGLLYRGRVGSGIGAVQSRMLTEALAGTATDTSPFADEVPRVDALGTRWVEPTARRRRRQPRHGLRAAAPAVVPGSAHRPDARGPAVSPKREQYDKEEVFVDVEGRTLKISSLGKVLYPRTGTTKGEVLNYYAQIAPVMLPHLEDRAVTRIRWPHGVEDMSFFEKNAPDGTPSWVRTATVPTTGSRSGGTSGRGGDGELTFPIVDDLATLTWMVNLAALELHVHQWTVARNGRPRNADRLVIDLDPGEPAGLHECCAVALLVREKLAERNLDAKPVLSGSKGLHLYADLPRRMPSDDSTRAGEEGGRGAAEGTPGAGDRDDDQGEARRQGVPRLVAERRLQDHHRAVLAARQGAPLRRGAGVVGRGRGRSGRPARPGAAAFRRGARAGRGPRRSVRVVGLDTLAGAR